MHAPFVQIRPDPQRPPRQQGWPDPPQPGTPADTDRMPTRLASAEAAPARATRRKPRRVPPAAPRALLNSSKFRSFISAYPSSRTAYRRASLR